MPFAIIDGINTRYDVVGNGPPLLMFSPGGFDATLEKWSTLGVYARIKLLDHLSEKYSCIIFDRRECGQSGGRVERLTWADYVAQGKGLLDHLNIQQAHVMGGCMGCCPVMAFGVAHPQATLSMILYWPVGGAKYRINGQQRLSSTSRLWGSMGWRPSSRWSPKTANRSAEIRAVGHGHRCSNTTTHLRRRTRSRILTNTQASSPTCHAGCLIAIPRRAPSPKICYV